MSSLPHLFFVFFHLREWLTNGFRWIGLSIFLSNLDLSYQSALHFGEIILGSELWYKPSLSISFQFPIHTFFEIYFFSTAFFIYLFLDRTAHIDWFLLLNFFLRKSTTDRRTLALIQQFHKCVDSDCELSFWTAPRKRVTSSGHGI